MPASLDDIRAARARCRTCCCPSCKENQFRSILARMEERRARPRRRAAGAASPAPSAQAPRRAAIDPRSGEDAIERLGRGRGAGDSRAAMCWSRNRRSRSLDRRGARLARPLAFDTETTSLRSPCRPNWSASRSRSSPGQACYVPVGHTRRPDGDLLGRERAAAEADSAAPKRWRA